jgi:hypothetical protein
MVLLIHPYLVFLLHILVSTRNLTRALSRGCIYFPTKKNLYIDFLDAFLYIKNSKYKLKSLYIYLIKNTVY